jgi:hypothetical protein
LRRGCGRMGSECVGREPSHPFAKCAKWWGSRVRVFRGQECARTGWGYASRAVGVAEADVNDEEQMQRFFQRLTARLARTLETAHEFCAAAGALTQDVPLPERPICKLANVDEPKIAGRGHGNIAVQSAGLRCDDGHGRL